MEECHKKKTKRSDEEKKIIVNRVNRISGQLSAINKMVQNDEYCNDILKCNKKKSTYVDFFCHIMTF